MINTIIKAIPWVGLAICSGVILTSKVDTKCPIRMIKMVLWVKIWLTLIFLRRGIFLYSYDVALMLVLLSMLVISILYIVETVLYSPRRKKNTRYFEKIKCNAKTRGDNGH